MPSSARSASPRNDASAVWSPGAIQLVWRASQWKVCMGVACGSHAEGCAFYERGVRILADLDEAERCASAHASPRGRVRVNANVPFGHHLLLPLVPAFLAEHPEVTLDIVLTDEVVDLLEQRTDVAVRAGPLKSSSLVARRLGATRM
ncbi:MAG: hypothetical protein D8H96_18340, partial [Lautropia sp.]